MSGMLQIALRKDFENKGSAAMSLAIDTEIPLQGVTVVFGESGAGKSTLLRCIAGLDNSVGVIRFGNNVWQDGERFLAAHQRRACMIFQHRQLFSHLSVSGNLSYAEKRCGLDASPTLRNELEQLFQIANLQNRMPSGLSGGEQQRAAIVRALLSQPSLLLLDEPLSALDLQHRATILQYLIHLKMTRSLPMIYVTHDLAEASSIADFMIHLSNGKVQASGQINALLTDPDQQFCSRIDARSIIEGTYAEYREDWQLSRINFDNHSLWIPSNHKPNNDTPRSQIAARDVSISLAPIVDGSIINQLPATITHILTPPSDSHATIRLTVGRTPLLAHITRRSLAALALRPGMSVTAQVKAVALY